MGGWGGGVGRGWVGCNGWGAQVSEGIWSVTVGGVTMHVFVRKGVGIAVGVGGGVGGVESMPVQVDGCTCACACA